MKRIVNEGFVVKQSRAVLSYGRESLEGRVDGGRVLIARLSLDRVALLLLHLAVQRRGGEAGADGRDVSWRVGAGEHRRLVTV